MENKNFEFSQFLHKIENTDFETNVTATGSLTIQQTPRNKLRREGLDALKNDLISIYGSDFDIVETKDGICIIAEGPEYTFTWELKSTIKALDYDPFIEAENFDEDRAAKAAKKQQKADEIRSKQEAIQIKRLKKLNR